MDKDRRRSPRIRQRLGCEIRLDRKVHQATVLDISEGGLAAVCEADLPIGSATQVSFRALGQDIEIQAMVWHCRDVRFRGTRSFAYGFMVEGSPAGFERLTRRRTQPQPATESPRAEGETPAGGPSGLHPPPKDPEQDAGRQRLDYLRAELDHSMKETRNETQGFAFRVRAKLRSKPRTKMLSLSAASEADARAAVIESLGADWEILEISAA